MEEAIVKDPDKDKLQTPPSKAAFDFCIENSNGKHYIRQYLNRKLASKI